MAFAKTTATGKLDIERLSALLDGELDAGETERVLEALCREPDLQRRWADLQLVGDAMRSTEVAACHVEGFCARVHRALVEEPTVLAPRAHARARRYFLPGAAIAASVAAIAFVAVPLLRSPAPEMTAQKAPPVATTAAADSAVTQAPAAPASKAATAIAAARALDPYFAAHRELTGGTPLPRATAYLRTAAGER